MTELAREVDREGSKTGGTGESEETGGAREVSELLTSGSSASASTALDLESSGLPSLRAEGDRLKQELDNARTRVELDALTKPPPPWWRKGTIVTTLTAIVAAVIPVTTAIQAHYQKERELVLQESKQAHEIRTSYLDRLDKPGARLRALRFVVATSSDPVLKKWASLEIVIVQAEIENIQNEIADINKQLQGVSVSDTFNETNEDGAPAVTSLPGVKSEEKEKPAPPLSKPTVPNATQRRLIERRRKLRIKIDSLGADNYLHKSSSGYALLPRLSKLSLVGNVSEWSELGDNFIWPIWLRGMMWNEAVSSELKMQLQILREQLQDAIDHESDSREHKNENNDRKNDKDAHGRESTNPK